MTGLSDIITNTGTIITGLIGWIGQAAGKVIEEPALFLPFGIAIGFAIFKRVRP